MNQIARCGMIALCDLSASPSQARDSLCVVEGDMDYFADGYVSLPASVDFSSALQPLGSDSPFPNAFAYAVDPVGVLEIASALIADEVSGGITVPFEFDKGTGGGGSGDLGVWRGTWASGVGYAINDVVFRLGSSYIAVADNVGHDPALDGGSNWQLIAEKGDTGDTGPSGGSALSRIAASDLSGQRVVKAVAGGKVDYASADQLADANLIEGITTGAAISGAAVDVQNIGDMVEISWSWSLGPVYCGLNGQLTQTPPSATWIRQVATAVDTNRIIINLQPPIVTP